MKIYFYSKIIFLKIQLISLYIFHHFEEFCCRILNKELHFIFEIWIITNMYLFIMFTICKHKSRICIWWQIRNCFAIHVYIHLHVILSRVSLKNKNIKSIFVFFLLLLLSCFQRRTTLVSTWPKKKWITLSKPLTWIKYKNHTSIFDFDKFTMWKWEENDSSSICISHRIILYLFLI